jgi:hypothetical protein
MSKPDAFALTTNFGRAERLFALLGFLRHHEALLPFDDRITATTHPEKPDFTMLRWASIREPYETYSVARVGRVIEERWLWDVTFYMREPRKSAPTRTFHQELAYDSAEQIIIEFISVLELRALDVQQARERKLAEDAQHREAMRRLDEDLRAFDGT